MVYTEGHTSPRPSSQERTLHQKTDALLGTPALQEVWGQLDQAGLHDREQGILAQLIAQPEFQAVLTAMRALPPTELASQLQADLAISYNKLQDACPTSIHDLRQRMVYKDKATAESEPSNNELSAEEKKQAAEKNYAANTRDYLMQVMTAVQNLADFLEGRALDDPKNAALFELYAQQEKRLGRLLVAIENDERQDLAKAA